MARSDALPCCLAVEHIPADMSDKVSSDQKQINNIKGSLEGGSLEGGEEGEGRNGGGARPGAMHKELEMGGVTGVH